MAAQGEDVYASLLLTDSYLPGALVLAHSLRDAGTTKKLAVLVTLDTVSAEVVTQLKAVYDYVIPVPRIRNDMSANLFLMNRPDLHSAFTKVNLWKQVQFRKIVYIDADVVAYRAPDELFDLPHAFSAAPDIGWPDLFNTGVMALTPNLGDYYALMAMAERGISFDGADQGLLNMHFKNSYNRLSFTYNVTPSAHYQYVPAYKHFQSSINMVHFIGSEKPWAQGRNASAGDSPYNEMLGRWWAVYDRHYRKETTVPIITFTDSGSQTTQAAPAPEIVQYFVKGEYQPRTSYVVPVGPPPHEPAGSSHGQHYEHQPMPPPPLHFEHREDQHQHQHHHHPQQHDESSQHDTPYYQHHAPHQDQPHHHHHDQHDSEQHHDHDQPPSGGPVQHTEQPRPFPSDAIRSEEGTHTEAREDQAHGHQQWGPPPPPEHKPEPPQPPAPSWDAQWHPPPADSKPEAENFPQTHYEMSSDPAPFVPPERYPSPPRNMWYEVPKERPAPAHERPRPIFPWETHQPRATRVFASDSFEPPVTETAPDESGEHKASSEWRAQAEPSMTGSSTAGQKSEPETPTTPTVHVTPSDPWSSFTRTNAWDDVPEIERYVDSIQKHRRTRSQGLKLGSLPSSSFDPNEPGTWIRRGSKVTDFPSEVDRPSLPVTPAPIRRPKFWGGGGPHFGFEGEDDDEGLPAAEGVPTQSDWVCVHGIRWSPADCLCDLANVLHYHKDPVAQLQKLARQQSEVLLQRLGSGAGEAPDSRDIPSRPLPFGSEDSRSPTYVAHAAPAPVLSPQPLKPGSGTRVILASEPEAVPRTTETGAVASSRAPIPEPSYSGPGLAFEKGEDVPTFETPALPTEEEQDVLET
ncbi:hypothetical protein GQ53DRAFT_235278 [Thozetella sp. PMI_491]|nr:hypothetical protein GQ53DRAFT_235278 [Thozetella sp. PMI_491]